MPFSNYMEKNIEVSFTSNIHTEENLFCSCFFQRFVSRFFSGRLKKYSVLWSVRVILDF